MLADVCFTVKEEGHAGEPLDWPDQQLGQRLPAAVGLGLVDLQVKRSTRPKPETLIFRS